jgi:hypothetical protein
MRQRRLSALLLLAGVAVAYYGSLLYAARSYPAGYAWRHTVVSNLANPNDNPSAWRVAADGMAVTGILLALLGPDLRRSLRAYAPTWASWAGAFFVLGGTLLMVSALILPGHHALFGIGKAHAKIAQAAGFGFGLGMACALPALLRLPKNKAGIRAVAIALVVVPITLFLVCRFCVPATSARMTMEHGSFGEGPLLGSLAFWEWVGSISVYAFLALVTLGLNNTSSEAPRR